MSSILSGLTPTAIQLGQFVYHLLAIPLEGKHDALTVLRHNRRFGSFIIEKLEPELPDDPERYQVTFLKRGLIEVVLKDKLPEGIEWPRETKKSGRQCLVFGVTAEQGRAFVKAQQRSSKLRRNNPTP